MQLPTGDGIPELKITLTHEALHTWGLQPATVLDAIHTAYQGNIINQLYDLGHATNVVVMVAAEHRQRTDQVQALYIRTPSGTYGALSKIGDIQETVGRYLILHEGGRRLQTIMFNVHGANPNVLLVQIKQHIAS